MMSRTGGGHVAAAEALTEALEARYGAACQVTQLDVFTEYMNYPFNRQPQIYAHWIRNAAWLYGTYFAFWNLPLLHRLGVQLLYQPNRAPLAPTLPRTAGRYLRERPRGDLRARPARRAARPGAPRLSGRRRGSDLRPPHLV